MRGIEKYCISAVPQKSVVDAGKLRSLTACEKFFHSIYSVKDLNEILVLHREWKRILAHSLLVMVIEA